MKQSLNEVKRMQIIAGILKEDVNKKSSESPEFKEISLRVMNDMLDDCLENYDGDFEDWLENGMSFPPENVQDGLDKLEAISSPEEVEGFMEVAYQKIEKYLKKHRR